MLQVRPMSSAPLLGSVSGVSIGNRVATKLCMWQCERSARSAGGEQWRRCAARGGVTLAAVALRLLLLLLPLLHGI